MKAKLKVIKNWEFEEFELTGTSFKYSPTGCKGMVARSEDEIVFWTYHLVQKCSGVLWVKGEVSRWIPSPEPKEQQDVWEDPVLLSCDRGILLVCPASKSLWWMPQMDGEWIPIPMDNWCAQGIPKPVAVTGSQGVFPIVCRVDNSADATNSFTSLTVDFETMTAHWAESGSCVYSKAGTRQTHLAAVERAGGNFAQADFHYNYPMRSEKHGYLLDISFDQFDPAKHRYFPLSSYNGLLREGVEMDSANRSYFREDFAGGKDRTTWFSPNKIWTNCGDKVLNVDIKAANVSENITPREYADLLFDGIGAALVFNFKRLKREEFDGLKPKIDWSIVESFPFPAPFEEQRYIGDEGEIHVYSWDGRKETTLVGPYSVRKLYLEHFGES